MHVDGAARGNPGPAAIGVVIRDGQGKVIKEISEYLGRKTNNEAEYQALIRGLTEAIQQGATEVDVMSDSQLLVEQMNGRYKVRTAHLLPLHEKAVSLFRQLDKCTIQHVPRQRNARADLLANQALDAESDRNLGRG